jgi:hypothetical protein
MATARNIVIILAIAALVVLLPGGGTGAAVAFAALRLAFYFSLAWIAAMMYRERRSTLYGLGDVKRAILYVALGVGALTLAATPRLWQTGAGSVAWLLLLGISVYAAFAVFWSARQY